MKYEIDTFDITTSVENGTVTESDVIDYGSDFTVEYAPNEGYHIAHVIVDGEEVDITEHPTSYTFENITSEHTIDVKYEIDTFDITTSVENGTITASQTVDWGSSMKIEYSPKEDYHLVSVNVDGQDIDIDKFPTRYYVMFEDIDTNHTVDVKYSIDTYSIFTNIENGSITESCEVEVGSNKTIEFSPTFGYHITKVTVDGDDVDFLKLNGKLTFNDVQENHSVNVICEKDKDIVETISNALPKTGSDLFLWVIVLGFVGTFSIAIAVYSRKLKHKEKKAE